MQIFSHSGVITPADDKTNIALAFTVPEGVSKLMIDYSYNPKDVEDKDLANSLVANNMRKYGNTIFNLSSFLPVHNLITLSFDENGEYRGACHRQPNKQTIIIAENDSTPGVFNRPITAGEWKVVLNVHFAGCDINYSINVSGEVEE